MTYDDPYTSTVDYDREEARSAALLADPAYDDRPDPADLDLASGTGVDYSTGMEDPWMAAAIAAGAPEPEPPF